MGRRTDCLFVGFNETDFDASVSWCRSMGEDTGAFRDVRLAFIEHEGRALHAMEALNRFSSVAPPGKRLTNVDFLWPTITYLASYLERRGFTHDFVNRFQEEK